MVSTFSDRAWLLVLPLLQVCSLEPLAWLRKRSCLVSAGTSTWAMRVRPMSARSMLVCSPSVRYPLSTGQSGGGRPNYDRCTCGTGVCGSSQRTTGLRKHRLLPAALCICGTCSVCTTLLLCFLSFIPVVRVECCSICTRPHWGAPTKYLTPAELLLAFNTHTILA